jgi:MraZ protein
MLRGNYFATVGEDGRVKMPSAWLESLRESGNRVFVTSLTGDFARIYPMKIWNEIKQKLASLPSSRVKRKFLMRTRYYGRVIELDGRGRIVLPRILRETAQLRGDVDLLGDLAYVEVWNHARFVEVLKNSPIREEGERFLQSFEL